MKVRVLAIVLGDQLDASVLEGLDPRRDAVWMAEVDEEITHVPSHKLRIAAFLSAMRHHRDQLRKRGWRVLYTELSESPQDDRGASFADVLALDVGAEAPERLRVVLPGEHRVLTQLEGAAGALRTPLDVIEDRQFYLTRADFDAWMQRRRSVVLETFYRMMRRRFGVLVTARGKPSTGRWNYDENNRASFGREGPEPPPKRPREFSPDATTSAVMALVERRYGDHPGRLDAMVLPVTRRHARALLRDFVTHRLGSFGRYEDAMWEGEPFLFHSRLSFALNVKLLDPRECVRAAVEAYEDGRAPIASVEGFVRQILGWRELVRGLYWHHMPGYATLNALGCDPTRDVPRFFWDGETSMACVRDAMRSLLEHAYTHHIQRLMLLGLFAQLAGVHPYRFHAWHMAMYADAIDWVSLPNALGMSQYGDGGIVGTKPYCASGRYIDRMSNYCGGCRYAPGRAVGEDACPFTTLYWDFLGRHRARFASNARMALQLRNLDRKSAADRRAIGRRARSLLASLAAGERV